MSLLQKTSIKGWLKFKPIFGAGNFDHYTIKQWWCNAFPPGQTF